MLLGEVLLDISKNASPYEVFLKNADLATLLEEIMLPKMTDTLEQVLEESII